MGWGWVAKSEARQLATAALWVRIRHTLARQKNIQKKNSMGPTQQYGPWIHLVYLYIKLPIDHRLCTGP
jgi:hypothetical protein